MPQICTNCLYINDGKYTSFKGSLIGGLFLIGAGIVVLSGGDLLNIPYLALIIAMMSIAGGILSLRNYYKNPAKVCPNCKHKTMLPTYDPDAEELIEEHGFMVKDEVTKFCTNCHFKGKPKQIQSLKYSLLILFGGIVSLPLGFSLNWVGLIGSFLMIGVGIYGALTSFRKPNTCPSCKNYPMIPIDSDEAKSFIQQEHTNSHKLSPEQVKASSS